MEKVLYCFEFIKYFSNWVIPEKIHTLPGGWHASNSRGRGVEGSGNLGRRKGGGGGGGLNRKTYSEVIFNENLDLFKRLL